MASACVNSIGVSPESLLERSQTYSSYGWLKPRFSIGREMSEGDASKSKTKRISSPAKELQSDLTEESDPNEFDGFQFSLEDPVIMLPADELFSDGKLIPLHLSVIRQEFASSTTAIISGVSSPDTPNSHRRTDDAFASDPYLLSPRAPRCSSRWKELLGFRKLNNAAKQENNKRTSLTASHNNATGATRSIRQFLHRNSKSTDSSVNLPLLKDTDNESVSVSSRPSLSSSSSGHDLDDLPRLSLDSDKPGKVNLHANPNTRPKTRLVKTRTQSTESRASTRVGRSTMRRSSDSAIATTPRGLSVDSPRMNSSGKIVFHSLERSSSSPSSLNGGPRFKHRGMERSYSANVRVTPVLNVPVGSLKSGGMFGFPIFSSQQKRECSSSNNAGANRSQRFTGKSRTDCS